MEKPRHPDAAPTDVSAETVRLKSAFDSLGLVDSELDGDEWIRRVTEQVGEEIADEFYCTFADGASDAENEYGFTYSSFEKAKHFSVGWRSGPLAAECAWMLPLLRDAIARSGHPEPFLVEIGAGPGAAAAVFSAALQVPVIAVDAHPLTSGLPEQFGQCTGGNVSSRVADIADLAEVLDGRVPAAVFGMGIYRYLQPHQHRADSFSNWFEMERILATHEVDPRVDSFIAALANADLVVSEQMCPDYLAEMASGLFKFGYRIPQGGIRRITSATPDGPTAGFGVHFSKANLPKRNPNLLIEMCSPLPRPYADFASDPDNDPAAEALRLSLEPTEFIEATEIEYTDGSGLHRRELFRWGKHLIGQYEATTRGYRRLRFFPGNDLDAALQAFHEDEAELEQAGAAVISDCSLPGPQWGSALDK